MLFEMNENPKVIQQLLGHRDVKTTITVYNSVDSEYIRQTTDKFNERVKEDQMLLNDKKEKKFLNNEKTSLLQIWTMTSLMKFSQSFLKNVKNVNADAKVIWKCKMQ